MNEYKCPGIVPEQWEREQEQSDDSPLQDYDTWNAETALCRLTPEVRRELFRSLWKHELAYLNRVIEERKMIVDDDPRVPFSRRSQGVVDGILHTLETLGIQENAERCG